jgi:hypothetical protein
MTMAPTVNLLLVEDDEVDIQGLKRAFGKSRIGNPITVARDGIEALEILRGILGGHAPAGDRSRWKASCAWSRFFRSPRTNPPHGKRRTID